MHCSIITGTGSYIPAVIKKNTDFTEERFYDEDRKPIHHPTADVVEKFKKITGIEERRYAQADMTTSDMATIAALEAIQNSGIDPERIDQIIVAHNYGNVRSDSNQSDTVPALASRVKHKLGIKNPACVPYDIIFGCPGWLQGVIQADLFIRAGAAKTCLVIGAETLSRVIDHFDRDSMIFADGAGACIIEQKEVAAAQQVGILNGCTRSDCTEEVDFIDFGTSYGPDADPGKCFIKMKGRKVYEYALKQVPEAMKACLDASGVQIDELKKVFIHQANEKMDEAILKAFYGLYGKKDIPANIMPMSIQWLGNSSVATIPTLYDMVRKGALAEHTLNPGDVIMFASVGAGMNINAVCYRYNG